MAHLQFLLDENLDPIIQKALQERQPEMVVGKLVILEHRQKEPLIQKFYNGVRKKIFAWSLITAPQCPFI